MKIPNKVNQTVAIASYLNLRCLDKHNGVRTNVFKVNNLSFNTGERIVQNRHAFVAEVPLGRLEPLTHRHLCHTCKITRKLFVFPGKDVATTIYDAGTAPMTNGSRRISDREEKIVADTMQMLGSRAGAGEPRPEPMGAKAAEPKAASVAKKPAGKFDDMEDDIPF